MTESDFVFYADSEQAEFEVYSDWEMTMGCDEDDECGRFASRLVSFATKFGLSGNLWQQWIAYLLISDENPLSLACERKKVNENATMLKLARSDFEKAFELFNEGPESDDEAGLSEIFEIFSDYRAPYEETKKNAAGEQIKNLAIELSAAGNPAEFGAAVTKYYEENGCGIYGLYRAFRIEGEELCMEIKPITDAEDVMLSELVGYDDQKEALVSNTEAFIKGLPANNVLLYGDSGTGKSTSVHALIREYYSSGLRMIDLVKSDRNRLPELLSEIKKRNYKFVIFMDDLSFEEDESDYKELKAMLEGALESREENVLIYATSNRRHLIKETWKDRNDMEFNEDVHRSDTMEEKLSLASRFGVTIYYGKPDYKEYMNIVEELVKRENLSISYDELSDEARKWSLRHGSTSGRTASQLIKWIKGRDN